MKILRGKVFISEKEELELRNYICGFQSEFSKIVKNFQVDDFYVKICIEKDKAHSSNLRMEIILKEGLDVIKQVRFFLINLTQLYSIFQIITDDFSYKIYFRFYYENNNATGIDYICDNIRRDNGNYINAVKYYNDLEDEQELKELLIVLALEAVKYRSIANKNIVLDKLNYYGKDKESLLKKYEVIPPKRDYVKYIFQIIDSNGAGMNYNTCESFLSKNFNRDF